MVTGPAFAIGVLTALVTVVVRLVVAPMLIGVAIDGLVPSVVTAVVVVVAMGYVADVVMARIAALSVVGAAGEIDQQQQAEDFLGHDVSR